jgi:putative phosphoesterase
MKVGLMANSHDRLPAIEAFVTMLSERGISMVLHAGDFVAPWALRPFREHGMALLGVFGHNDGDPSGLVAFAQQGVGMELYESPHVFDVAGKKLLLVHDLQDLPERAWDEYDIIVHGTTHNPEVHTEGKVLVISAGEACGWLTGTPTCATLDLATNEVEFLTLNGPEWKT